MSQIANYLNLQRSTKSSCLVDQSTVFCYHTNNRQLSMWLENVNEYHIHSTVPGAQFLTHDAMLSSCVCLSVHLSHASIVSKWLNLGKANNATDSLGL